MTIDATKEKCYVWYCIELDELVPLLSIKPSKKDENKAHTVTITSKEFEIEIEDLNLFFVGEL